MVNYRTLNNKAYASIREFSLTRSALILLIAWSFFEASIWFIIPEFILIPLVIANPDSYKRHFKTILISSTAGALIYVMIASLQPDLVYSLLIKIPFTNAHMIDRIMILYSKEGIASVLRQAFSGIPSKVWSYAAVKSGFGILPYVTLLTISRGARMAIVAYASSIIGRKHNTFLRDHICVLASTYILIFFIVLSYLS